MIKNEYMIEAEKKFNLTRMDKTCPNCGKELVVITPAFNSVNSISDTVTTKALCCGKPVVMRSKLVIELFESKRELFDDWNQKLVE